LLVEQDGKWQKTNQVITIPNNIPNNAIKEHHHQMISKADLTLETQSPADRDITGMTVAVDKKQLPEIKEKIDAFKKDLSSMINRKTKKNQVYQLNIQFFKLT